jgi:hypothetical protein
MVVEGLLLLMEGEALPFVQSGEQYKEGLGPPVS